MRKITKLFPQFMYEVRIRRYENVHHVSTEMVPMNAMINKIIDLTKLS